MRITADASPCQLETVDTITYDNSDCDTVANTSLRLEAILGHTPNLKQFKSTTNLGCLSLFNKDPSLGSACKEGRGKYYVYKCITESDFKLPENQSFGTFGKGRNYGDAFVFKVDYVGDFDGKFMAIFDSMEEFWRSLNRGGSAVETLKAMARW